MADERTEKALMAPPILALPNATGHTSVHMDACTVQAGSVLIQQ